jgi:hypothetical protein
LLGQHFLFGFERELDFGTVHVTGFGKTPVVGVGGVLVGLTQVCGCCKEDNSGNCVHFRNAVEVVVAAGVLEGNLVGSMWAHEVVACCGQQVKQGWRLLADLD